MGLRGLSQCFKDMKSVLHGWKYILEPKKKSFLVTALPPFSYMELTMAADVGIK